LGIGVKREGGGNIKNFSLARLGEEEGFYQGSP
jgi:hypothetical protein